MSGKSTVERTAPNSSATAPPRRIGRLVVRIIVDFGSPIALYYVLRAAGASVYVSLLVGALLSAAMGVKPLFRKQKLDGLAIYMSTMMLGSVVVSLVGGSTRFLLARDAALTGVTGIWFIASLWARRPLAYLFTKPLVEGRMRWPGNWDLLWRRAPRFRRMWRISSVLYGIGTLGDAAARVVMAYTLPPDVVPALGTALYAATTVFLLIVVTVLYIASGAYNLRSRLYQAGGPPVA